MNKTKVIGEGVSGAKTKLTALPKNIIKSMIVKGRNPNTRSKRKVALEEMMRQTKGGGKKSENSGCAINLV